MELSEFVSILFGQDAIQRNTVPSGDPPNSIPISGGCVLRIMQGTRLLQVGTYCAWSRLQVTLSRSASLGLLV